MASRKFQTVPPYTGSNDGQVLRALVDTVSYITAQAQPALNPLTASATINDVVNKINDILERLQGTDYPTPVTGMRPWFSGSIVGGNAGGTYCTWNVLSNVGGCFNGTLFICPTDGIYHFDYNLLLPNSASSGDTRVSLYKNGLQYDAVITNRPASAFQTNQGDYTLSLVAGDKIGVFFQTTGVGNIWADPNYGKFSGFRVD